MTQLPQKKVIQTAIYLAAITLTYTLLKANITDFQIYKSFQIAFASIVFIPLHALTDNLSFDNAAGNFIYQSHVINTSSSLALKYYVIVIAILLVKPTNYRKSFIVLTLAFIALYLSNVLKYANDVFNTQELVGFVYWVNVSFRYLIVYLVLKYKLDQHQLSQTYFAKLDKSIQSIFQTSLHRLLLVCCAIPAIAALFDWFLLAKWNVLVDALSALILGLSNTSLHAMGYTEAFVTDKTINLGNYWLYLGTNCLGVGLMMVFSALILSIKSPLINRLIYVPLGIFFIILLNALRINVILLHIFKNQTPQKLIEDYHDLSNNVYYIIVFLIILLYIGWFQHINIKIKKSPLINSHR